MAESFQNEVPKARINITLDLETGGARKKKELPMKLLVLGDFSSGKTNGPVAERERIPINKINFDKVLKDLSPEVVCEVVNRIRNDDSDLKIHLKMDSMWSFRPEAIVAQVPELKNLLAMRNLLRDLKSNLLDNKELRLELEKLVKNGSEFKSLFNELKHVAQLNHALPKWQEPDLGEDNDDCK